MRKISKVKIEGFWDDKEVILNFKDDVNFLIGVNGSGKTTIINLIAASLNADFATLDKIQFRKIKIDFFDLIGNEANKQTYIIVEKTERAHSPYSNIIFKIKIPGKSKVSIFQLNEIEEDSLFRHYPLNYIYEHRLPRSVGGGKLEKDINVALKAISNVTWLSIHRTSGPRSTDDKSFESTIDLKLKELSTDMVKYFGILDRKYSLETEKFQKNIFLSLIEAKSGDDILSFSNDLDEEDEKESLKQIFLLFKLKENEFESKLENHYESFTNAKDKLDTGNLLLDDFAALLDTKRIHSIVQEWNSLNEKKTNIHRPKFTLIEEINNLFQRKKIIITERNELQVETQSGKIFPLSHLSSGEKQLLIILGQCLLQENQNHVFIADEPELSLHIEWQEKLVSNLKNLNPNAQIIFATHSPDIVSNFSNSVINIEDVIL